MILSKDKSLQINELTDKWMNDWRFPKTKNIYLFKVNQL